MRNKFNSFLLFILLMGCSKSFTPEQEPILVECADEVQQIKEDEGSGELIVYRDTKGYLTAGYGHLLDNYDQQIYPLGSQVEEQVADYWFKYDMYEAYRDAEKFVGGEEVPPQINNVLVNMAFNLGYGNLSEFVKMKEAILKEDWGDMAYEMERSDWYEDVGFRSHRLVERVRMFHLEGDKFCNRFN